MGPNGAVSARAAVWRVALTMDPESDHGAKEKVKTHLVTDGLFVKDGIEYRNELSCIVLAFGSRIVCSN